MSEGEAYCAPVLMFYILLFFFFFSLLSCKILHIYPFDLQYLSRYLFLRFIVHAFQISHLTKGGRTQPWKREIDNRSTPSLSRSTIGGEKE